jgi:hypothetical protein
MVWNQVSSNGELTNTWAVFSGSISWALIPANRVRHLGSWDWMAELFGEEWSVVEWLDIVCIIAVPCALSSAARLVLELRAPHVVSGILAHVFKLAETTLSIDK